MKATVIAAIFGLVLAAGSMGAGPAKAAPAVTAGDAGQGMLVADSYSFRPPLPRHLRQYNESRPSDRNTVFRPASQRSSVPGTGVNRMPRPLAPQVPAGQQVYRPVTPRQYTPGTGVDRMPRPTAPGTSFWKQSKPAKPTAQPLPESDWEREHRMQVQKQHENHWQRVQQRHQRR